MQRYASAGEDAGNTLAILGPADGNSLHPDQDSLAATDQWNHIGEYIGGETPRKEPLNLNRSRLNGD
jgi:hypothetical protein